MHNYPIRNFGLDVIRATAIVLVVLSHCTYIVPEFNTTMTDAIRLLGATGVDIFFVLSGYLIGGILLRKLNSEERNLKRLFHFWKRRWLRTLPNYFVVLILNVILIGVLNKPFVDNLWKYMVFIQNFIEPHPDFFTEAWSLSIEEFAYLFLPLLMYIILVVLKKMKPSKVFVLSTFIIIGILLLFKIQFYYSEKISTYQSWSSQFRKVVLYRLDAIYYGFILVYVMSKYAFLKTFKRTLLFLGIFGFVMLHLVILIFQISPESFKLFFSIFYLPFISLSIALVFPWFLDLKAGKRINKIVTYISMRSYAIYLVNYSLVLLTLQYFLSESLFAMLVYISITLALSEMLYKWIEQPFLRLRQRIVPRK